MVRMIDMFPEDVRKKLDFFNKDKYTIATEEVDLKEKKKYGEVCLKCKLNKDTLIFMEPEKNTLPYLDEKIKYAKACPDARALAGFLNMQVKEIHIYSAYRNDKIESMDDSLIQIRSMNMDPEALKIIREWKKGKCSLDLDSRNSVFPHEKIQLDQDGKGECVLKR